MMLQWSASLAVLLLLCSAASARATGRLFSGKSGFPDASDASQSLLDFPPLNRDACGRDATNKTLSVGALAAKDAPRVDSLLRALFGGPPLCAFETKQCTPEGDSGGVQWPDWRPGDFGTCALVGNGWCIRNREWGGAIDAHDTVFRWHKMDLKPDLTKWTGNKTDILFVRRGPQLKRPEDAGGSASKAYQLRRPSMHPLGKIPPDGLLFGKPILNRSPLVKGVVHEIRSIQSLVKKGGHFSGGFTIVNLFIASRLCTRVDLYGFCSLNKYPKWNAKSIRGKGASKRHPMAWEHWWHRNLMSKGLACVYGE